MVIVFLSLFYLLLNWIVNSTSNSENSFTIWKQVLIFTWITVNEYNAWVWTSLGWTQWICFFLRDDAIRGGDQPHLWGQWRLVWRKLQIFQIISGDIQLVHLLTEAKESNQCIHCVAWNLKIKLWRRISLSLERRCTRSKKGFFEIKIEFWFKKQDYS